MSNAEREIQKLYQLVALHELPYVKWTYKRTKQISIVVWIMLPLVLGSFITSTVTAVLLLVDWWNE